ncbi:unnamed protein product, partial [Arctogadus glacialis]
MVNIAATPTAPYPRRAVVFNTFIKPCTYGPDDDVKDNKTLPEDEHLQDDGLSLDGQEGEYLFNDDDDLADHFSCQNSPLSNGTNPDAGYASPLSNSSEQLADTKTPPPAFHEVQEEKPAPAK